MVKSGVKWVIFMLMGEYHHSIDDKGRLTIPSKVRDELGTNFIVTRGLDGCLYIYSESEWQNVIAKYKELPNIKDARNFMRFFLSGAINGEFDKQGRVKLSLPLIKYAKLKKECVIIGVNDHLEVWDKESWDTLLETNVDDFTEIADKLFDTRLNV